MIRQTLAGRYQIISHLGGGAFGQTYLAEDAQLPNKDQCVVKHLKPQRTDEFTLRAARHLFEKEAKVLNHLGKHDQIPRLLAHFEENQEFYLVQEFIEGEELTQELTPGKQLSEAEVIDLLQDILEVLVFVHQQNIIHRDIKPSNVIRRRQDGKIVLIDFGAVKQISTQVVDPDEAPTEPWITPQAPTNFTVAVVGTPGYMPREQFQGKPRLSSDIYGVGMIGIQALTGLSPHQLPEIIWRISEAVPKEARLGISPRLAKVLDAMIHNDFSKRYPSAKEALEAIEALKHPTNLPPVLTFPRVNVISLIGFSLIGSLVAIGAFVATLVVIPEFLQFFGMDSSSEQLTNNLTYENHAYGIKIKYPQDWQLQEVRNPISGTIAIFLPEKSESENFHTELIIEVENLKKLMSLAEYTTSSIDEITQFLAKAKILDSHPATLAKRQAHKVIYTGKDEQKNLNLKSMQIWMLKNDKAYVITYTAEESKYANFLKPVEGVMIESFEIP